MCCRWRWSLLVVGVITLGLVLYAQPHDTMAQDGGASCRALVQETFEALRTDCAQLGRNEVCLANGPVTLEGETPTTLPASDEPLDLNPYQSVQASQLDVESEQWGVVAISEGGGLPANTAEYVTMWLFGEAELLDRRSVEQRNAPPTATCYGNVTTDSLNIRSYPATNSMIFSSAQRNDTLIITGRLADTSWWRIEFEDQPAWVVSGFLHTNCQIVEIPVILRDAPALLEEDRYKDPFQIAALRTVPSTHTCDAAPPSGLLLHPPEIGHSNFSLNGVKFDLSTSLYVQANAESGLLFQTIEGPITLNLMDGWSQEVPSGAQIRFPLSEDGLTVTGPATGWEPLDVASLAHLPLDSLPHPIEELPPPLIEIQVGERLYTGDLIPGENVSFYFDNRGGSVHQFALSSDAYPVLSIADPDRPLLQPYITQGQLEIPYWTFSDLPHLFQLAAGTVNSGSYQLNVTTRDLRFCRSGLNRQSRTLIGGEDHAGNIWFGHEGEVVTLTASGDVSETAGSIPRWRLRITEMFLETPTLPPIQYEMLEGVNADTITWTVPQTGYYWVEVWTTARGTTTVTSRCE